MDENFYNIDLISKYLTGEATADEIQAVEVWIRSNDANKKVFDEYKMAFEMVNQKADSEVLSIDVENEWKKFRHTVSLTKTDTKIIQLDTSTKNRRQNILLRIAAILIVPILIGAYFIFFSSKNIEFKRIASTNKHIEQKLPDNSVVTLNSNSSIEYADNFEGKDRKVSLKGEAHFDVTHNAEKPFIVETNSLIVKVIGTSFYINTINNENTAQVMVESGIVEITSVKDNTKKLILKAGEKTKISNSEPELKKEVINETNYNSWKTMKMVFDNTSLAEIVETINRVYQTQIIIKQPNLQNCRMSTTFDNQPLEAVIKVIEETLNVKFIKNGNIFEVSGNGC